MTTSIIVALVLTFNTPSGFIDVYAYGYEDVKECEAEAKTLGPQVFAAECVVYADW